jgi:hypothetical protein
MKATRITISTDPNVCVRLKGRPLNGLVYAEILGLLSDYDKFERGIKGTRFDTWLAKKAKKNA